MFSYLSHCLRTRVIIFYYNFRDLSWLYLKGWYFKKKTNIFFFNSNPIEKQNKVVFPLFVLERLANRHHCYLNPSVTAFTVLISWVLLQASCWRSSELFGYSSGTTCSIWPSQDKTILPGSLRTFRGQGIAFHIVQILPKRRIQMLILLNFVWLAGMLLFRFQAANMLFMRKNDHFDLAGTKPDLTAGSESWFLID